MNLGAVVSIHKGRKPDIVVAEALPGYRRLIQIDDLRPAAVPKFCPSARDEVVAASSDVIIAWDGANAATSAFGLSGVIGSTLAILRPRRVDIFTPYLGHFVQAQRRHLRERCKGATVPHIDGRVLESLEIPLPPLPEQRRIAGVLDRADELRAKRRTALAQLDTLTQSIFLDMFGDAGGNPEGWPIQRVSDYVAEFQGGRSIVSESGENVKTRNRVLKVSAVTSMKFLAHESKPVPDIYEAPPEHFARPGDLLFSRANTTELVGAIAYIENTPPNLLLSDKLWRFIWRQPAKAEPLFVWALFQTPALRREIGQRATGTSGSMKNISQEKLLRISTILPPFNLQHDFARRVGAVENLKATHRASLAELDGLFASLQYRAFRGEL